MLFLDFFQGKGIAYVGEGFMGVEILRETLDTDAIGLTKDCRPLDDIAQLPDVSRPGVLFESLQGFFGKAGKGPVIIPAIESQ